ncbi:hypothetical protein LINGRAHAP2_LOCUS20486 [Linum grandiflorum]
MKEIQTETSPDLVPTAAQLPPQNLWDHGTRSLFMRQEEWYVADSDSENVAESAREEDNELGEDADTMCPAIMSTAA